jgi:hypothetical protein
MCQVASLGGQWRAQSAVPLRPRRNRCVFVGMLCEYAPAFVDVIELTLIFLWRLHELTLRNMVGQRQHRILMLCWRV